MIKSFSLELKALSEQGVFQGLASTYDTTPDSMGDIILPGAFTATLAAKKTIPLLLSHSTPIGLVTLSDSPAGLVADGKLSLGLQAAKEALILLQEKIYSCLSIGFVPLKEDFKNGIRALSEIKLYEISLVMAGANPNAVVTSVKERQLQEEKDALRILTAFRRDIRQSLEKGTR